jgi:anti-sigma B factor antagonist
MSIDIRLREDIAILTPKGVLTSAEESDELEERIKDLVETGNRKLVVDLGRTKYITARILGILAGAHTTYARRQGQMKLCRVDGIYVFRLSGEVRTMFDVYDTEDNAVGSFT